MRTQLISRQHARTQELNSLRIISNHPFQIAQETAEHVLVQIGCPSYCPNKRKTTLLHNLGVLNQGKLILPSVVSCEKVNTTGYGMDHLVWEVYICHDHLKYLGNNLSPKVIALPESPYITPHV